MEMNDTSYSQVSHAASNAEVAVSGPVLAEPSPPENNPFVFVCENVKLYLEGPEALLASTSDIKCAMNDIIGMPYKTDAWYSVMHSSTVY